MAFSQLNKFAHSGQSGHSEDGPGLASTINEEFLNLPSAQQRVRLQAVTGDKRFLTLSEDELHRYIANAINQVTPQAEAQAATRSGVQGSRGGAETLPAMSTLDHEGRLHHVPHDQLPEALDAGHAIVMPMTHPDGTHCYVPLERMHEAHARGFAMGHKSAGDIGKWFNEKIEQGVDLFKGKRPEAPASPVKPPGLPTWNGVNPLTGGAGFTRDPYGVPGHERPGKGGQGNFGAPRGDKNHPRTHHGEDISGRIGDDIHAAADGAVIFSGVNGSDTSGYGNTVKIRHGDGTVTVYGHNTENKVKVGDMVKQGQVIGTLGQTGNASGQPASEAHVHFEVQQNGKPVDPAAWLNTLKEYPH